MVRIEWHSIGQNYISHRPPPSVIWQKNDKKTKKCHASNADIGISTPHWDTVPIVQLYDIYLQCPHSTSWRTEYFKRYAIQCHIYICTKSPLSRVHCITLSDCFSCFIILMLHVSHFFFFSLLFYYFILTRSLIFVLYVCLLHFK